MTVATGELIIGGETIALALLRTDTARPPRLVLHRRDRPDWRLVFAGAPAGLPPMAKLGQPGRRAVTATVLAGVTAVALLVAGWQFGGGWLDALAPLVPQRTLAPIGRALAAGIGGPVCTGQAGSAALDRLVARLRPPGFVPVTVRVGDRPLVNALALPGGEIVVFRGLIDAATSADEVAGVVAHELAHVVHRDPTRALLRQVGLSLFVQSLGGSTGNLIDTAFVLRGSRAAERAADAGAVRLLTRAHIAPDGLAAFFRRQSRPSATVAALDPLAGFIASHPGDAERIAAIPQAAAPTTSALSAADWQALRTICYSHADGAPRDPDA